jgi:HlyD family secretion protein
MSQSLIPRDAIAFQTDLDEVLAEPPPRGLRATNFLLASLMASVLIIAAVVKSDIIVSGRGQLRADTPTILLQPVERAIIRELFVRAGDRVTKGEVVATLDATFSQADVNTLTKQKQDLTAKIARLEVEAAPSPPDHLAAADDAQAMQARLYAQRREEFRQHLTSFDQSLARDAVALQGNRTAAEALTQQLAIATDVASMRSSLMHSAVGSRLQFLAAESSRIQAEKDLRAARVQITELVHAIDSTRAERQAFVAARQREDLEELIAARAERARVEDQLTKATRLHDLIELKSPTDGVVLDVAARAPGSVLHEAEALITILPAGAALIAEVSVPSSDIGNLVDGQKVLIKVDAFPYQRHGRLHGKVRSIGEESYSEGTAEAFHKVRVALGPDDLQFLPQGASLIPGMTVTAEVNVGSRNVLSYFLYPITRGLKESLREP